MKITREKNITTIEIEDSDVVVDPGENLQTEKEIFADDMCAGMQIMLRKMQTQGIDALISTSPDKMISKDEVQSVIKDRNERWEILPNHG